MNVFNSLPSRAREGKRNSAPVGKKWGAFASACIVSTSPHAPDGGAPQARLAELKRKGSLAVAVTKAPGEEAASELTLNVALPLTSVLTLVFDPR